MTAINWMTITQQKYKLFFWLFHFSSNVVKLAEKKKYMTMNWWYGSKNSVNITQIKAIFAIVVLCLINIEILFIYTKNRK